MKRYVFLIILFIMAFYSQLTAQGEAAVPFLLTHPAPNLNGMAGAFTALPTTDAFGQYFNPAQLGNFSIQNNLSIQFYPTKTKWLPLIGFADMTFQSTAAAVGYNLKSIFPRLPVNVGLGYIKTEFNLGKNTVTDELGNVLGTYESKENYSAISIGLGLDYRIRINIGFTTKQIYSKLGGGIPIGNNGSSKSEVKTNAQDYGIQLTVPIIKFNNSSDEKSLINKLRPYFDISFGYTRVNNGGKVRYSDSTQADPLPREVRIGYALSLGTNQKYADYSIRFIQLDWSLEARDMLIKIKPDGSKEYAAGILDDINIWDNFLLGKSDDHVSIYEGFQIRLFEIFQYCRGWFKYAGESAFHKTNGFLISTGGLFKWLAVNNNSNMFKYAADHFKLEYIQSKYTSNGPLSGTEFTGISLMIYGF